MSSSIYENVFIDLNVLKHIGKYVYIKRKFKEVIKELRYHFNLMNLYDLIIEPKKYNSYMYFHFNYFHNLSILTLYEKIKISKNLFRNNRIYHHQFNKIIITNQYQNNKIETIIKNKNLIKLWNYKILNKHKI